MTVRQPIFIVGTGRSGSTAFFDVLARHPHVAWLSALAREWPARPGLNAFLMRAIDSRALARVLPNLAGPSEAYPFWEMTSPGFSNPCRDLRADDATPESSRRLQQAFGAMTTRSRHRFLAKITGWPRLRFLSAVFPDAHYVEVVRDLAATACSLIEVPFWDGWRGPPGWRRGPLPPDLEDIWQSEGRSFVALAAIECVLLHRAMGECKAELGAERIVTVSYSELCSDAAAAFGRVTAFCGLPWTNEFAADVSRARFVNRDDAWRARLSAGQQAVLLRTFERAGLAVGRGA